MTVYDKHNNEVRKATKLEAFKHYLLIALLQVLIVTSAVSFVLYNSEREARQMERVMFEKQLQETQSLKEQN